MSAKPIKLVYFNIRGRCEYVRMVMNAAGVKYEEQRIEFSDWPKIKPTTPTGQLPYIEIDGKVYTQSHAIAAYFAHKHGFYGKTPEDGLRVAEVVGIWSDQIEGFVKYRFAKDDASKAEFLKKVLEEDLPKFFGMMNKMLPENGYFVGGSLSLADMYVYDMQDNVLQLKPKALDDYPRLKKLRENVKNHPKLKSYLSNRKETTF